MNQIEVCERIAPIQRDRATTVRQRCRIENTRRAMIANRLGYHGGLPEAERKRIMKEADALIERIIEGEPHALSAQVITLEETIKQLKALEKGYDKRLAGLLRHLPPIVKWVEAQRGLSLAGAAIILGETGDLSLYANPAKVWKRLGLAPKTSRGQSRAGSTWRRLSKTGEGLHTVEWSEYGYSPRRRSIAYVAANNLVRAGKAKPDKGRPNDTEYYLYFLRRKEEKKALGWKPLRCLRHANMMLGKQLVLNFWIVWTETYGFREYIKPAPPAESNGKPKKNRGRKAVAK